jgi:hypothetical protein
VVSSATHSLAQGAVYVFSTTDGGSTWSELTKVRAYDGEPQDGFGGELDGRYRSLSVYQDTLVVGAPFDDVGDSNMFRNIGMFVYIFVYMFVYMFIYLYMFVLYMFYIL